MAVDFVPREPFVSVVITFEWPDPTPEATSRGLFRLKLYQNVSNPPRLSTPENSPLVLSNRAPLPFSTQTPFCCSKPLVEMNACVECNIELPFRRYKNTDAPSSNTKTVPSSIDFCVTA